MAKKKTKLKLPPQQAGIRMTANKRDGKKQLTKEHVVSLTTLEALALVDAANYAANRDFDDGGNWLRSAFNAVMDQCGIECEFSESGRMVFFLLPAKSKGGK